MGTTWGRRGMMRDPHGNHMGYMGDDVVDSRDPRGYHMGTTWGTCGKLEGTMRSKWVIPAGSRRVPTDKNRWQPTGNP